MKVSIAYVFIAASTIAVVNSEINPHHRFLKAKASKVSQTKASKSKSSKSDIDRCADVDCSTFDANFELDTCFNGAVCNPDTGLCEGVPDNEFCPQTGSQCSERICGVDGLCLSNDINEGDECFIVGGNACTISTCKSGSCNSIIKECSIPGGCNGSCNSITGDCEYLIGAPCPLPDDNNVCTPPTGTCNSSGSCEATGVVPACPPGRCKRDICDATDGCNAEDNTNNGGACGGGNPFPAVCCNGVCCPEGQTCQDIAGVSSCGGS